ncbi:MAG TPA: glycoside hydrolase family 30 beta sandwich domain-containing protein [Polyangiaceae bacterium]
MSFGVWFAFAFAACSSGESPEEGSTAGTGGSGGATGGVVAGQSGTGSAGKASGGSTGGGTLTGGTGTSGGSGGATGGGMQTAGTGGSVPATGGAGAGSAGLGSGGQAGSAAGSGGLSAGGSAGDGPPTGGLAGMAGTSSVPEPLLVTSVNNAFWQEGTATEVTGNADITVNDSQELQDWSGFGGTFNEKGWEALAALSQADRDRAIRLLFDTVDGARFVSGRIPIGASDYAMDRYTLNDNAGDTSMSMFSIARDRMRLIPYIKAALAVRPDIRFWGSPWTPPPWMKDNNNYDRGNMKSDATTMQALALYLTRFVEEYEKEGIAIDVIHPQNEPGYQQDYPSCGWTGTQMATFIKTYLAPTFTDHGLDTKIFCGTMSNPTVDKDILNAVVADAGAKAIIKGFGLQWGLRQAYDQANLDENLEIWQTEHQCGNFPNGSNANKAPNDFAYGVESWGYIRDWIKKGVNHYSAWNMVLDTVGRSLDTVRPWAQNALLAVDVNAKQLIVTPTYYVFRHASQYADPGGKVVGTSSNDAIAFKNPDGTMVAVIYANAAKTITVAIAGKKLQFQMPGQGWATLNVQ